MRDVTRDADVVRHGLGVPRVGVRVGVGTKVVMDVDDAHQPQGTLLVQVRQQVCQRHRVGTARHGREHTGLRRGEMMLPQRVPHARRQ